MITAEAIAAASLVAFSIFAAALRVRAARSKAHPRFPARYIGPRESREQ